VSAMTAIQITHFRFWIFDSSLDERKLRNFVRAFGLSHFFLQFKITNVESKIT
jgi:hypothetical protein